MLTRLALSCLLVSCTAAFAQSPPKTPVPSAPKAEASQSAACAQADTQATVGQGGDVKVPTPEQKPLGQKLAQSNGVICPPGEVDPGIHKPAPEQGTMPVIPPPGTPLSPDQTVKPK
jgi:hypothetical protein